MKFPEMPYTRPQFEEVSAKLRALLEKFKAAASKEECFAAFKEIEDYTNEFSSMFVLSFIRNSLDTTDKFYEAEKDYGDEVEPMLEEIHQELIKAMLASPFRKDMEAEWGAILFDKAEIALKTFKPEIIADLQAENRLSTEYDKLLASAQIEFDGKTHTLAQMGPYYENPDRAIRKAAMEASANWRMKHVQKWDSLFSDLTKLRHAMGEKLGHKSFTQVGYYRMERMGYGKEEVEKFREGVVKYIVPVAKRLKEEQAKRIGVDKLTVYDDPFEYPDGNAKPTGTPDEIFAHGKQMYKELSGETDEFMKFMTDNKLFDVLTRPGKSGGGYCHFIPKYKSPFIFANFNGTSGDIDVLTHEAGHAYAAYKARNIYPRQLSNYSSEIAEIHSMAMEFLTWPWMEGFFGDQVQKYYYAHLAGALTFIPYGTMVDEFQHHIYDKPQMSPDERCALWLELEKKYRPWLNLEDFPFYGEGRRWQAQSHIYETPFYYIDYCLAEIVALSFWAEAQKDRNVAWQKYDRLVGFAGTKTFTDLLTDAGMPTPFEPENLKIVSDAAVKWLDTNAKQQ